MPKGKKELQFLELVNSELIDSYYWFYNKDEFGIEIKYENIFEFMNRLTGIIGEYYYNAGKIKSTMFSDYLRLSLNRANTSLDIESVLPGNSYK